MPETVTNEQLWKLLNGQIVGRLKTIDEGQVETNRHLTELNGTVASNAERSRTNEAAIKEQWDKLSDHRESIAVLKTEGKHQKEGATSATADRKDLRGDLVKLAIQVAATGAGAGLAFAIARGLGWN